MQTAMDGVRGSDRRVVEEGVASGTLRASVEPEQVATVFTATQEGGIMPTQLYDDPEHVRRSATHLIEYLQRELGA